MKFEKNVGTVDRIVRLVIALVMFGLGYLYLAEPLNYVAYLIAVIMLFTGTTQSCMAYQVVGISTMEKQPETKKKK